MMHLVTRAMLLPLQLGLLGSLIFSTSASMVNSTCSSDPGAVALLVNNHHCHVTHPVVGIVDAYFKCMPNFELHANGTIFSNAIDYDFSEERPTLSGINICINNGMLCTSGTVTVSFEHNAVDGRVQVKADIGYFTESAEILLAHFTTAGLNCGTGSMTTPTQIQPTASSMMSPVSSTASLQNQTSGNSGFRLASGTLAQSSLEVQTIGQLLFALSQCHVVIVAIAVALLTMLPC